MKSLLKFSLIKIVEFLNVSPVIHAKYLNLPRFLVNSNLQHEIMGLFGRQ